MEQVYLCMSISLNILPGKLTVIPHASFKKVATSLSRETEGLAADNAHFFAFTDYDELSRLSN
jgi:hypothetical protein